MKRLTKADFREFLQHKLFTPLHDLAIEGKGFIGLELESFAHIEEANQRKRPLLLYEEPNGLANALLTASTHHTLEYKNGSDAKPVLNSIYYSNQDSIRFEPGGQLEIISSPCISFKELREHIAKRQALQDILSKEAGIIFTQSGTNPWFTAKEIGLQMQLPRYQSLANYLESLSAYGPQMMLQTCSMHINLDLGADDKTKVKRFVAANLLSPFAAAIFANSPIIAGEETSYQSYRTFIWQNLDSTRTGIFNTKEISRNWTVEAVVDAYYELAMNAPIIYNEKLPGYISPQNHTLAYWIDQPIQGISPSLEDFERHLTLLFPTIRLKGYLELRVIDAPPREWQMAAPLFFCGLLYTDSILDRVLELLLPLEDRINVLSNESVYGLKSDEIFAVSRQLMELAISGNEMLIPGFMDQESLELLVKFSEKYTAQRKTFADDAISYWRRAL